MNLCVKHQEYFQIMFLEQGQIFRSKFENAVKTVTKMVESLNFNMVWELSWSLIWQKNGNVLTIRKGVLTVKNRSMVLKTRIFH